MNTMKNEPLSGRLMPDTENNKTEYKAHYHLPGLFEFYELYKVFLPLYRGHREYFYDWCDIGSVYGAPGDCLWGGGRVGYGDSDAGDVLELMSEYGISARLTFSNSLLGPEHLADKQCNDLCRTFEDGRVMVVIIDRLRRILRHDEAELFDARRLYRLDGLEVFHQVVPPLLANSAYFIKARAVALLPQRALILYREAVRLLLYVPEQQYLL